MGIVIKMKARRRHGRASAELSAVRRACIAASNSNVMPFTPRRAAKPTISDHISAGILPRARQLLTTGGETERAFATSEVPPSASMSESRVMIIDAKLFTNCEGVKLHGKGMEFVPLRRQALRMAKRYEAIGKRLEQLREALGITQAELCRQIKCQPNRWNQYKQGDRKITLAVAERLCDEYGATLDWIYRDNRSGLPQGLYAKLYRAA